MVIWRRIYFAMKVWSRTFAVNVRWVSIQQQQCNITSWNTQTLGSFAVVHVVNTTNTKIMLWVTSKDVLLDWDMSVSLPGKIETENKQSVDNCLLDRVATVDSRLVSKIRTQIQTVATCCVFQHETFFIQWTTIYRWDFAPVWSVHVFISFF